MHRTRGHIARTAAGNQATSGALAARLNRTTNYIGFAIQLKTPTGDGEASKKQADYLEQLEAMRYKMLVSSNDDTIVIELAKYHGDLGFPCKCCSKSSNPKQPLAGI